MFKLLVNDRFDKSTYFYALTQSYTFMKCTCIYITEVAKNNDNNNTRKQTKHSTIYGLFSTNTILKNGKLNKSLWTFVTF